MGKSKLQAYLWGLISLRVYLVPPCMTTGPTRKDSQHTWSHTCLCYSAASLGNKRHWLRLSVVTSFCNEKECCEESRLPPVRERDLLNSKIWSLIIIIARAVAKKVAAPAVAKKVAKKTVSKKVKKTVAKKGGKTGKKVARKAVKKVAAPKKWEIDH